MKRITDISTGQCDTVLDLRPYQRVLTPGTVYADEPMAPKYPDFYEIMPSIVPTSEVSMAQEQAPGRDVAELLITIALGIIAVLIALDVWGQFLPAPAR